MVQHIAQRRSLHLRGSRRRMALRIRQVRQIAGIAFDLRHRLDLRLELKRYRLFHARLGSISNKPFAREKHEVKIQPEDHALVKNFAYR